MSDEQSEQRSGWFQKLSAFLSDNNQPDEPKVALLEIIQDYKDNQTINDDTATMMESLLELSDTQVRDIMIPRGQMTLIQENWSLEKVLTVILEAGHSRYPVVDEEHEKVLGILITKDLLPMFAGHYASKNFIDVIRPATIVPESKALDAMLRDFKMNRNHMAMVIDEYGSLSGLVTIEDVIEEIVGEIDDEHDEIPDAEVRAIGEDIYQVKALMPIANFNERFNTELSDEDADTIGGYLLQQFGRMPTIGEFIIIFPWRISVAKANQRRILSLKVDKAPKIDG
ncbi:HlyC/CorC family transporter [Suttonella ornithocola]|uniref:Magnesium and cobalt efflux protein CorC n=1 Tax=Suttonella ornithocola TaxID=279832 RepID=A0A380MMD9_9GAMM|nr:transporter associated domain-containing protein [Suttonella ornithocola]SUO93795.1 Magnesium and cobalt efflux protein CorC [Suttonella ornithocola]